MNNLKPYFAFLNLLFLTGIAWFAVTLFYGWATIGLETQAPLPTLSHTASPAQPVSLKPIQNYRSIIDRNLFGTAPVPEQVVEETVDLEALKPTSLDLKLWGTAVNKGGNAYAVIESVKSRLQTLYREGDSIENATVKLILRGRVILNVDGKDEILEMENPPEVAGARSAASRAANASSKSMVMSREKIEDALKNLNTLMSQVRVRPHFENGKPAGLSMTGIKGNSLFSEMGFKSGDVLTGVEGQEIQSVSDVIKLYEKLRTNSDVSVQVKRRGQLQNFQFEIQ